jgi:chromosome segregation ATPase
LQLDAEQTAHATTRVELNTQLQQAQQVLTTVQNELQASLAKKEQQLVLLTAESGALKHSLDEAQTGLLGLKIEYDKLRTRVKSSELATQGDSGVGTSAAVPAAAMSVRARAEQKSQEMARLLQPDATSTVVELVAANHGLRKELDELRREHDAELNRRQTELSKLHRDYGEVKQEYQSKVSELTAKVSKLVAKEQEHRPHSRVKELQQELELVQAKYVALQAKETPQNSSSGVEETEALKADLAQAHSVLEQWQNHCEELKTESQSLQVQIATQQHQAADLQGRLDAALELAERHRRDRLGQEEQAAARQAKSTQALKKSKQQIADFTSEVKQRDAALASMQERLEAVHQQLAEAPLPSVVLAYERQLRQLDADKHGLELELDQAQKYQTPTMQHFNLLQRRIAQLEAHHRERERSLKHLLVEQERSAALDRQEVESKWQQRLVDEVGYRVPGGGSKLTLCHVQAARVNVLESELQGLMRQLRQLQRVV